MTPTIAAYLNRWKRGPNVTAAVGLSKLSDDVVKNNYGSDASFVSSEPLVTLAEYQQLQAELERYKLNAGRYAKLRAMHWRDGKLAVVRDAARAVRPDSVCPSMERLDAELDAL